MGLPTIVALASAPATPAALLVQVEPLIVLASDASRLSTRPLEIGVPLTNFPLDKVVLASEETAVVDSIAGVEVAPLALY